MKPSKRKMQNLIETTVPRPFPMNFDFHLGETHIEEQRITAERFFSEDELVFAGHFPSNKILPGVMLVEYALYLGEMFLLQQHDGHKLTEIKSSTFLSPVFPGGRVGCKCEFSANSDGSLAMKSVLTQGEVTCAKVRAVYGRRV